MPSGVVKVAPVELDPRIVFDGRLADRLGLTTPFRRAKWPHEEAGPASVLDQSLEKWSEFRVQLTCIVLFSKSLCSAQKNRDRQTEREKSRDTAEKHELVKHTSDTESMAPRCGRRYGCERRCGIQTANATCNGCFLYGPKATKRAPGHDDAGCIASTGDRERVAGALSCRRFFLLVSCVRGRGHGHRPSARRHRAGRPRVIIAAGYTVFHSMRVLGAVGMCLIPPLDRLGGCPRMYDSFSSSGTG